MALETPAAWEEELFSPERLNDALDGALVAALNHAQVVAGKSGL